jgi:hypothetical protein
LPQALLECRPKYLRLPRSLIDNGAPVDDIDEATGEAGKPASGGTVRERQQPDRHDGCLAETGRDRTQAREIANAEFVVEPDLPGKRAMACHGTKLLFKHFAHRENILAQPL